MEEGDKGQWELFDKHRGRAKIKRPSIATVVFIVVILVLASLSISLYALADHYGNSKYRSQHWLVVSLCDEIDFAQRSMGFAVDVDDELGIRYGSAMRAEAFLVDVEDITYSIQLMYSEDSTESDTLGEMHGGLGTARMTAERIANRYYDAITQNATFEFNTTIVSHVSNLTSLMDDLQDLIWEGVQKDSRKNPYSVLEEMDFETITSVSRQISDAARDLNGMI